MARKRRKRDDVATDRLDALREKMGKVDASTGSKEFWKPKPDSRGVIRIVPGGGDMDIFFQPVGRHRNMPGEDGPTTEVCPEFTTFGEEDCPICELASALNRGSKADKALATRIWLQKSFWMNVVVRAEDDEEGETATGPFIFTPGVKIYGSIETLVNDPEWGDPSDPEDGYDIIIERTGSGRTDTSYEVNTRRFDVPIHVDTDEEEKLLDAALDLSFVMLTEDPDDDEDLREGKWVLVKPYDRIVDEYGLETEDEITDFLEDVGVDEEEVEAKPKRKPRGKKEAEVAEVAEGVDEEVRKRRRRRRR